MADTTSARILFTYINKDRLYCFHFAASGDIKLLDLVRELHEFVGWMQLGLHLGVPKHTLERIRQQCATYGEVMCKTEMLSTWLDGRVEQPTWAEVVSAVSRSGNRG